MSTTTVSRRTLSVNLHVRLTPALFERLSFAAGRSGLTPPALARAVLSDRLPQVPPSGDRP
jgi:hypothetical protein